MSIASPIESARSGQVLEVGRRGLWAALDSRGPKADIHVRRLRAGRFEVTDRTGRHVTTAGAPIVAVDPKGGRHQLVLHAFATNASATVSTGR